ncbi:uncharacterized protein LOC127265148 [Andrographis paniculata]|uniref:uncharacterized protein LOC127265148 n=1 Tax=Andrographis paniculata TaxID=175694 RepID=UPI0021E8C916|nr:uncharacterized protein LOC127265148 [Andrographis paniculata]
MAALASLANTCSSIHTLQNFHFLSSSRPPTSLTIFVQHGKNGGSFPPTPISSLSVSSFSYLNSYVMLGTSRVTTPAHKYGAGSPSIFKPFSTQQGNHPHQANSVDGSDEFMVVESGADKKMSSSLGPLVEAYKKAILEGDGKTIYEVEEMIIMIEKGRNDLVQKVSHLSAEISSRKEKCVRLQADFDNYRKRSEKEKLTVRSDAQGEMIESLLPIVDSFERARQQIKLITDKEKSIDASYQGIYKQFVEIMRSLRVAVVPTVGKPFDPSVHEAIARVESQQFKEGIIVQELHRGFFLGDRLLRPAVVKVSSGPGKKKPSVQQARVSVAGME